LLVFDITAVVIFPAHQLKDPLNARIIVAITTTTTIGLNWVDL